MEYTLTSKNFEEIINQGEEPILVDFWASWCAPCMMLSPIVEELSKTHRVGKVNVDEEPELAREFNVNSIPCLLVFKNGELLNQSVGYQSKEDLEALMEV